MTSTEQPLMSPEGEYFGGTRYILSTKNSSPDQELVVLVHGIGGYSFQYDKLSSRLEAEGYATLKYDLIGRGYSSYPVDPNNAGQSAFGADGHVAQLRELMIGLQLTSKRYHMIAHSMGGAITALYAHQYYSEILSVVFLSPAGLMSLPAVKLLKCCSCLQGPVKSFLRSGQEKAWRNDFIDHSSPLENEVVAKLHAIMNERPTVYDAFWQSVLHFPLYGLENVVASVASRHNMKVLIAWGRNDKAVPFSPCFARWKAAFDDASHPSVAYHVYDNAGHAFFMEREEEVHADIINFLVPQNGVG
jgi:pimeloyl-ACP methyl ester carboxylesterase